MKYLENSKIDELVSRLTRKTVDCYLETKLESYSCKLVTREKRQFKAISNETGRGPNDLQALSPSNNFLACSPTRLRQRSSSDECDVVLCDVISTKTLFYLTATLNESFRDYDFSNATSHDFSKEGNVSNLINTIDCRLMLSVGEEYAVLKPLLWNTINEEICIRDCDVYSYIPDSSSDPYSECLWSFNHFFYNRKLKRVLFFTCMAKSFSVMEESKSFGSADEDWLGDEMDD